MSRPSTGFRAFRALAMLALAFSPSARADQGGVPFWFSGQFSSLAAVPATPGWSLAAMPYYYNGSAAVSKYFQVGATVSAGLSTRMPLLLVQPGYAAEEKILGGQPYLGVGFGIGRNNVDVNTSISLATLGAQGNRADATTGGTDLYPFASLSWNKGVHNWMTYLTGDVPTGAYNSQRLANIGIGHGAIDVGGGYTYLNPDTGREFSAVLGATYNLTNTEIDYRNGVDSHLDWAVSQFLSEKWQVGIAGYAYQQLSPDTYDTGGAAGALRARVLGSFESRVFAAGPELGHMFTVGGQQAYLNLRGYKEFGAQNRIEGYALFANLAIPLGSRKSK